jgi:hypothetical protein
MHLSTFARIAPALYRSGTALELVSGPGVGKSTVIEEEIAVELSKLPDESGEISPFGVVTNILSQMDPVDIKGFCIPVKDPNNAAKVEARFTSPSVFPNQWNVHVYVNGVLQENYRGELPERGILFLDEFGQSSMETQKVAAQLILSRRIGEYKLPRGWRVWCASNRLADKSGVNKRLSFVQNRMKTINIQPAFDPWMNWAAAHGIHPLTITFAKKNPHHVFKDEVPAVPGPYCTPRSLVLCTQDLIAMRPKALSDSRLPDDEVAGEIAMGWLGEAVTTDFLAHIRIGNQLPEVEDVVKNPSKTMVPERSDAKFIMASMLAHHSKLDNTGPIFTYVQRMDMEMQVLYVFSIARRSPPLMGNQKVCAWMTEHQALMQAAYAV